ncbi:DUF4962 domain-containing protein [Cohnella xylanilytica]|uniref:DUF4962 domain-containing protein n=1 Tax=Cohnella xylanilytica TaxID=557555 RepID=A0A841UCJ3_9BACL|nr:DUF4962 domain-containing protein [Cohnella xylanilytica]MBB6695630.1 DUF4962 domain-containing protein [Cohnella xylanilytica]
MRVNKQEPGYSAAPAWDEGWPGEVLRNANMPFRPTDGLVTTQNPPDFSWPYVPEASDYHLQIARTASMDGERAELEGLKTNYCSFSRTLTEGAWYWRVRFRFADGGWSPWSSVRRFRIAEENVPFPVPPIDEMMARMERSHPRVWTNPGELEEFRRRRFFGSGKAAFDRVYASVQADLGKPFPPDPPFPYLNAEISSVSPEFVKALQELRAYADTTLERMLNAAFVYLLTGEENVGAHAKSHLLNVTAWDPSGSTRFDINDQVHRAVAYRSAIAYDWLHDLLSPGERQAVQEMIKTRVADLIDKYLVSQPIYQYLFDSHGWTIIGYIGLMGAVLLHDIPEAEEWMRRSVPAFVNLLPPWGGEDGSWSQGTGYWQWSSGSNKELMDILFSAGAINLYDKAFSRHEGLYPIYMFPHGSPTGVFGNDSHYKPDAPSVRLLNRMAQIYRDPRLKWAAEAIGDMPASELQDYFYRDDDLPSVPPADLPPSRWFPVTGLVAMHSELLDRERISLYFKSSPYGSYSHSQADQNGFIVHAFGEPLAIKSGVYDYYNSAHHRGFTKRTYSANAITCDGRKGQPIDDFDAKGRVLGFVHHPDFDAVSGDATAAYRGELTRAVRHIVYVRPTAFVVIDELATDRPGGSEFEWNLHADEKLAFDSDGLGATIEKGGAGLRVRLHGGRAHGCRTVLETAYRDPDGREAPPVAGFAGKRQVHGAFVTPRTESAVLAATLAPYRLGGDVPRIAEEELGGVLKLTFDGGAALYIRTAVCGSEGFAATAAGPACEDGPGPACTVGPDGIRFAGAAAAAKGDTFLLVGGTWLEKDGVVLARCDVPSTIVRGDGMLSISAQDDAIVDLKEPGPVLLFDADSGKAIRPGGEAEENMSRRGVHWTQSDGRLTIRTERGQRTFRIDVGPGGEQA